MQSRGCFRAREPSAEDEAKYHDGPRWEDVSENLELLFESLLCLEALLDAMGARRDLLQVRGVRVLSVSPLGRSLVAEQVCYSIPRALSDVGAEACWRDPLGCSPEPQEGFLRDVLDIFRPKAVAAGGRVLADGAYDEVPRGLL